MNAHIDPEKMSHQQLLDYCYSLEQRLQAEAQLASEQQVANLRRAFRFSAREADIVALLADGRVHSQENILLSLYSLSPDDMPGSKIVDVFVCKARAKMAGSGLGIETQWGCGYFISDAAKLKAIMDGEMPVFSGRRAEDPRIGRPVSARTNLRLGEVPRLVSRALAEIAVDNVATITMRELGIRTQHKAYGASTIRAMAVSGWLEVIDAPSVGGGSGGRPWVLRLLPKALAEANGG